METIEYIEDIKYKITDNEYLKIMNSLMSDYKMKNNNIYFNIRISSILFINNNYIFFTSYKNIIMDKICNDCGDLRCLYCSNKLYKNGVFIDGEMNEFNEFNTKINKEFFSSNLYEGKQIVNIILSTYDSLISL